jgi:hypothetical protein
MAWTCKLQITESPYRILVEKCHGKQSVGRSGRRWEDNIEMDIREVCCEVDESGPELVAIGICNVKP